MTICSNPVASGIYKTQERIAVEHEPLNARTAQRCEPSKRGTPDHFPLLDGVTYRLLPQIDTSLSFGAILSCASSTDPDPR